MPCCGVHPRVMSMEEQERELDGPPAGDSSEVSSFYDGACVLITGATGFLGTVLLEKLLRSCPGIDTIYLLLRPKKGVSQHQRLNNMLDGPVFSVLRRVRPDFSRCLTVVSGDCSLPGLGLSQEDSDLLASRVSVVFHVAATVRFDEDLRTAVRINVAATYDLIRLSRRMSKLKAFVHVSSAYSNCIVKEIDECFYRPGLTTHEALRLIEIMNDEQLSQILPKVLKDWPNTYAFTKAVAEDCVRTEGAGLPIGIVRPSIVITTSREPVCGWVSNVYGPTGVVAGAGLGILRTMNVDKNVLADMVPADFVINATIVSGWDIWRRHSESGGGLDPPIYNYVSSVRHPITWGVFMKHTENGLDYPSLLSMWYYYLTLQSNRHVNNFLSVLLHLLPAFFIDRFLVFKGKKPILWSSYEKVHKFTDVLSYFAIKNWKFSDDNVRELWQRLSLFDRHLFHFDIVDFDWEYHLTMMSRGVRLYVAKEDYSNLEKARARWFRLKVLHYSLVTVLAALLLFQLYRLLLT